MINTKYKPIPQSSWKKIKENLIYDRRFSIIPLEDISKKNISYLYKVKKKPLKIISILKEINTDVIIIANLKNKNLIMKAYSKNDGQLLWSQTTLSSSSLKSSNFISSIQKLINDFSSSIPFQGFQILDPLIGQITYDEGEAKLTKADIGHFHHIKKGDSVQWIEIKRVNSKPLYQGGSKINIIAKGHIIKVINEIAILKINQARNINLLKKYTLISFPKEHERLIKYFALNSKNRTLNQIINKDLKPVSSKNKEIKKSLSNLLTIGNILAFILLAL